MKNERQENIMVKVSVIVPVYNTEHMLKACIDSLLHQTLQEIELIFVDDGSTDGSLDLLHQYRQKDRRIRLLSNKKNMGGAIARNKGLSVASGKYIQFVDSDDYIERDTLESLYRISEQNHAELCYMGMQFHLEKGVEELKAQNRIRGKYPGVYDGKVLLGKFIENNEFFLYLCSVFYRRSFLEAHELNFRNLFVGEGGNLILRSLCHAKRVVVCPEKYYHYRIHGKSVMHSANTKKELLTGQIVQFIDVLHYFSQEENAPSLAIFLEKLWKEVAGGIQNLSKTERLEIEHRLETGFAKYIFYMLQQKKQSYGITFDENVLKRIEKKASVIIYGAGYASREMLELLNQYDIAIVGFAVTERRTDRTSLYGHPIYEIQELIQYKDSAMVLVAANIIYNQQIQSTLEQWGFQDYIFLNVEI